MRNLGCFPCSMQLHETTKISLCNNSFFFSSYMYLDDIKNKFLFGVLHLKYPKYPNFLLLKSLTESKYLIFCLEMEYLQWLIILCLLFGQRKICKQVVIHKIVKLQLKILWESLDFCCEAFNFNRPTDLHSFIYFGEELKAEDWACFPVADDFSPLDNSENVWMNFICLINFWMARKPMSKLDRTLFIQGFLCLLNIFNIQSNVFLTALSQYFWEHVKISNYNSWFAFTLCFCEKL